MQFCAKSLWILHFINVHKILINIVAAFRGMNVSPAKHSYA